MPTFPPYTPEDAERLAAAGSEAGHEDRHVPFYQQSLGITCGPAALMMAMAYFDPEIPLDRDLEIALWREANLVEVFGTSREGLAVAAACRGFEARTQGDPSGTSFVGAIEDQLPEIDTEMLELFYEDTRDRFDRLDLTDEHRPVTVEDLHKALHGGELPLVLTDASQLGSEAIPHWVLVRGFGPDGLVLNDPQAGAPGTSIPPEKAKTLIGFDGITCAVYLGPRTREHRRPHP